MTNHKVKNATPLEYNNIQFKSRLEVMIYKTLLQEGFNVQYEPTKYIIWEGFKPNVSFYNKDKKTRMLKLDNKRLIDITYTPDFVFEYKDTTIVIEAKGFENDIFPIKKKLFRKWLEKQNSQGNKYIFFEIFTKRQLMQAIDIIKNI